MDSFVAFCFNFLLKYSLEPVLSYFFLSKGVDSLLLLSPDFFFLFKYYDYVNTFATSDPAARAQTVEGRISVAVLSLDFLQILSQAF